MLLDAVLQLLDPKPGQVMLDCTLGRAGHAAAIVPRLAPGGRYIGLDVDQSNLDFARQRLADAPIKVDLIHRNFAQAPAVLRELGAAKVDLLLADFGFSSNQMDDPARGFSFMRDGPLDMRLDPSQPTSAADLVNRLPPDELADILYQYGEERLSRKIARKIAEERDKSPIKTTGHLADVVRRAYGMPAARGDERNGSIPDAPLWRPKIGGIDPATRTFMALRIAVNGELDAIEQLLHDLPLLLSPGGVAAIISFHSLEDRLVKQAFAELVRQGRCERLTGKPVVADETEQRANPRCRSAKLRAIRWGSGRA